jgi:hypothetical protein
VSGPVEFRPVFKPGITPGYEPPGWPLCGVGPVLVGRLEPPMGCGSREAVVVEFIPLITLGLPGLPIGGAAPYAAAFAALAALAVEFPVRRAGNAEEVTSPAAEGTMKVPPW